jgi:hypothetical protein
MTVDFNQKVASEPHFPGFCERISTMTTSGSFLRVRLATTLGALALALLPVNFANATTLLWWEWKFTTASGLQQGYFVTDGGPYSTPNPTAGTYNISNFVVASSPNMPLGSITNTPISTGGVYDMGATHGADTTTAFVWDDSSGKATQFSRTSGSFTFTNGSNFYVVGGADSDVDVFGFYASSSVQEGTSGGDPYVSLLLLNAVPTPSSAVPEIDPAGFGSVAALVTGALGLIERRRLKAKVA